MKQKKQKIFVKISEKSKKSLQHDPLYSICPNLMVKNLYTAFEMILHLREINNIYTMAILCIAII